MTTNPKKRSWYDQGFNDGVEGFADPPMRPGHRDYENYMAGNRYGERQGMHNADAQAEYDAEWGTDNGGIINPGFAWVVIGGMEPLARYCRKKLNEPYSLANIGSSRRHYGTKHWQRGWEFWGPGNFNGQAIGHKRAGAEAFAAVLAKHNINGTVGSRYD